MNNLLPIHFAPLQGYTDAAYRQAHARIFGGIDTYYSPFVRVEHGEIRRKDARDIHPDNNRNIHLIPQLIASCPIARKASRTRPEYSQATSTRIKPPYPVLV